MTASDEINADMLAFWNGKGGYIWVARREDELQLCRRASAKESAKAMAEPSRTRRRGSENTS